MSFHQLYIYLSFNAPILIHSLLSGNCFRAKTSEEAEGFWDTSGSAITMVDVAILVFFVIPTRIHFAFFFVKMCNIF